MLSSTSHSTWDSSHASSITLANARRSEQTGPIAEQAHQEAYVLWQRIEHVLTDARERRVAYLLFHCGFAPAEIVQRCAEEFADVQEVIALRCAVMKKLVTIL